MLKPGEKIGIITASAKTLTEKHLQIATNGADIPLAIAGMEDQKYFYDAIHAEVGELDFERVESEVVQVTRNLVEKEENIKAIFHENISQIVNPLELTIQFFEEKGGHGKFSLYQLNISSIISTS